MREMPGEEIAGFGNGMDQAPVEVAFFEMSRHFRRELDPERIAAALVYGFVTDNRKPMTPRRDKNQHAVSFARLLHAQP